MTCAGLSRAQVMAAGRSLHSAQTGARTGRVVRIAKRCTISKAAFGTAAGLGYAERCGESNRRQRLAFTLRSVGAGQSDNVEKVAELLGHKHQATNGYAGIDVSLEACSVFLVEAAGKTIREMKARKKQVAMPGPFPIGFQVNEVKRLPDSEVISNERDAN